MVTRKVSSCIYPGRVKLVRCMSRASTCGITNFTSVFKTEETESSDSSHCLYRSYTSFSDNSKENIKILYLYTQFIQHVHKSGVSVL